MEEQKEEQKEELVKTSKYTEGQQRINKGIPTIFSGGKWRRKCQSCDNVVNSGKIICTSCKKNISKSEEQQLVSLEKKIEENKKNNELIQKLEKEYTGSTNDTFNTCSEYLYNVLSDKFDIDFKNKILKPKDQKRNIKISLRTSAKPNGSKYTFRLVESNPHIYIFTTLFSKRMWIIKSKDLNTCSISIGIHSSATYEKYEVTVEQLPDVLLNYYNEVDDSYYA
jgi:hypothetical protein